MINKKTKFCPFREKPCRTDCMHYEGGFDGSRHCLRDTGYLIMREMVPAFQDLSGTLANVGSGLRNIAKNIHGEQP